MNDFEEAFKRYIPRSEWEALKAEWRVEEEGRKAQGADGKPEGRGQSGERTDQKSEVVDHGSVAEDPPSSGFGATRAPEDDAADAA